MTYIPKFHPDRLICGSGNVAVVTGWTPAEAIAKQLKDSQYAVVGNLYSATRGITPIIRNLLLNPNVRYVVILSEGRQDRISGAANALADFFLEGVAPGVSALGRECWRIKSEYESYIDGDIPLNVLFALRRDLCVEFYNSRREAVEAVRRLSSPLKDLPPWGEAMDFSPFPVTLDLSPGPLYGHRIEGQTIAEAWVKIIHRIRSTGRIRPAAYGRWQELIDVMVIIHDEPVGFYLPDYLPVSGDRLHEYISQVLDDAPYIDAVQYSYGQRLRSWFGEDQVEAVINKLSHDPNSSRAVMNLWDASPSAREYSDQLSKSPPCLNHIWVRILEGELSLTATFRSNDMFGAWPSNAIALRSLQSHIQQEVSARSSTQIRMGPLITLSQSAHLYEDCWEYANALIQNEYSQRLERNQFDDPSGSFLVEVRGEEIVVTQISPGSGEVYREFRGSRADGLLTQLSRECPALQTSHALYLGGEIQRAGLFIAQGNGHLFRQDEAH